MSRRWLLSLCSVVLLVSGLTLGQGTTSRISGIVTDSSGAIVANATITAVNEGTGATYVMKSSNAGTYAFDLLQVGRYTIKTEAPGFKQFISTGNVLAIGVPTNVNPKLEVGGSTETVTVEGGYDLVQTESSGNLGGVIDSVTITQLPIVGSRGRNPVGLVQYMPGVVQNGANASGGGINVNGSRDRAWNYVMDGIDANESSSGGANTSPPHQNPDMLAEFRVITASPTAEYGRNSGAQVLMVTKSGSNQWHGNLFWFYQSPFLRANAPENKAAGLPRGQFVQNIPGGSLGGPIWKDKAFFFVNVELLHAATSTALTRTVYTQQARQGLFRYASSGRNQPAGVAGASVDANGNAIVPVSTYDMVANDPFHKGLDSAMQSYFALAPLPNNFQSGDGLNFSGYSFVAPSTDKQVDVAFKIDYRFNEKNSVYFRWLGGHQNTYADSTNAGWSTFPGLPVVVNTLRTPRNFAFNWRWAPTPKLANEFVAGMNRFGYKFENPGSTANAKSPFVTSLVTAPLVSALGNNRFLTTFQLVDNVTYVHGPHIFKGGINFRYGREIDQRGSVGSLNAIPQVTFSTGTSGNAPDTNAYKIPKTGINTSFDQPNLNTAINELLGRVGQLQEGYVAEPNLNAFKPAGTLNNMDHRWPEYDFYVQDTWHALPNLVLDFGIRVDARLAPDLHSFPGLIPNQSLDYGMPLTSALQFVHGPFMSNRWTNFGPSAGFAWDPLKDGKTSIRGSFRIAYDRINPFSFSSSVFQGMPGLTYQVVDATSGLDNFATNTPGVRAANWFVPPAGATPLSLTTPPQYSAASLVVSDPNMQTPTVSMWALSVQHELARNTVLTVSYIGNHGTHLYGGYDSNQSEFRTNGFLDAFKQVQAGQDSPLMDKITSSDTRRKSTETGTQFIQRAYASNVALNNVAGLANSLATRLQPATGYPNGKPLVTSSGLRDNFFKPYSQYLGGLFVLQTRDYSNYNGLQAQVEKRFSSGFLVTVNYTYSKSLDTRSFDPTFTLVGTGGTQSAAGTPFDYHTPRLNYAAADFDNTHVINGYYVLDLPFGHGRHYGSQWNRGVDWLVGGWQISGDGYWQSGRPLTIYAGSNTFSGTVQTPASCDHCDAHMGKVHTEAGQTYFLSAEQRAKFYVPAPGEFSNLGRNWLRQNATWSTDANLSKSFHTWKEQYLQLRFEVQNLLNNVTYDTMGSQSIQSSVFGRLNAGTDGVVNSSPRRAQLAAKYVF
ncbi:carboxypeptidase regulatory-like domain-containing protein [Edaphobacter albus]|uniref:carboxypeptidase regulatory-like domain-containing protein n=1 Tax=Edaphobacter sp. 4G125 TaxID=2763071 RepID=UPI0016446463|nr:carboxypeptidase regulatory-like domain-containing protein [Edaphobacter sp. 4G125]QNI37455.1 carboxypeptidase regulatory-like domain-containing protein [Edaphobacter sp. 4G125]